jgi:hypothetical protein
VSGIAELSPTNFLFHYLALLLDDPRLDGGAMITTGSHEFLGRDAVIRVFDLLAAWDDEFCWSFCSTSQIFVLVAVKIGETIDVRFDQEFERVFHVKLYNMSRGFPIADTANTRFIWLFTPSIHKGSVLSARMSRSRTAPSRGFPSCLVSKSSAE